MNQTMTTRQLADVAGVDISTIQKMAKKLFHGLGKGQGKSLVFDEAQSNKILESIGKKNFVERKKSEVERQNSFLENRMDRVEASLDRISSILTLVVAHQLEEKKQQISLPPIDYRSELNAIIKAYASKNEIFFSFAWEKFFQRVYYRLHIDISKRAKNAGVDRLDWAEENGYIEQLYQLAKEEF